MVHMVAPASSYAGAPLAVFALQNHRARVPKFRASRCWNLYIKICWANVVSSCPSNQMLIILDLIATLEPQHSGAEIAKKLRQNLTDPAWDPQFCGQIEIINWEVFSIFMGVGVPDLSSLMKSHETWFTHSAVQILRIRDAVRRRCSSMPVTDRCEGSFAHFSATLIVQTGLTLFSALLNRMHPTFFRFISQNMVLLRRPSARQVRHWFAPEFSKAMKISSGTHCSTMFNNSFDLRLAPSERRQAREVWLSWFSSWPPNTVAIHSNPN